MFGAEDEKESIQLVDQGVATAKSKGKGKQFLDLGDIEGQEFGADDDEEESAQRKKGKAAEEPREDDDEEIEDYIEEDDLANDDDAPRSKRSKASMGYTLS
jgi:CD2 antigen cytoplasmic tail-binding protein 2